MTSWQFALVVVGLVSCAAAQEASSPPAAPGDEHRGKVILSRSVEDNNG
jgi:hypothetical protein